MNIRLYLGASLLVGAACSTSSLVYDGSFGRWCGEELCDWTTDEGSIRRIATWHEHDHGLSLESTPSQISRVSDEGLGGCYRFTIVADVDPEARLLLEVDHGVDGKVEFTQRVAGRGYQRREFVTAFPAGRLGMRYVLRKDGRGKAHLADFAVSFEPECEGAGVLYAGGAFCENDDECASGSCVFFQCAP